MKSNKEQLESRGYVSDETEQTFDSAGYNELLDWLKDKQAIKRTIAARRFAKIGNPACIAPLCMALERENKLYTKMEISNSLAKFGKEVVPDLTCRLGKIGKNQHADVADEKFGKNNYPLPRDIIARTLIRIGTPALPELLKTLQSDDTKIIREAIDAIGFICFYSKQKNIFPALIECYDRHSNNDLIRWKISRAASAFPESKEFLDRQYKHETHVDIRQEIERSLTLINTGKR